MAWAGPSVQGEVFIFQENLGSRCPPQPPSSFPLVPARGPGCSGWGGDVASALGGAAGRGEGPGSQTCLRQHEKPLTFLQIGEISLSALFT